MSKKNSIVLNHKNCFSRSEQILKIFLNFKTKLLKLKTNKFLVAVSGGPDSLALAAMCKAFESIYKKKKILLYSYQSWVKKKRTYRVKKSKKNFKKTTYFT